MSQQPVVRAFFDEPTNTVSYLVADEAAGIAAVIDPVLDYNFRTGAASTDSAEAILDAADQAGWTIEWVLETHAHADHLSGAPFIKARTGAKVAIGRRIAEVQQIFRPKFEADDVSGTGAEFDRLLKEGDTIALGGLTVEILETPGHTPACIAYKIGDNVWAGDTIFMPDYGTARCDFPGGDARTLFRSIRKLLALPEATVMWMCHDYKSKTRDEYAWKTTVGDQRRGNIHVHDGVSEDEFVTMRETRDATLDAPLLLLPSIQTNIRAGALPPAEESGVRFLRIPVDLGTVT